jgi:hypothetical protein
MGHDHHFLSRLDRVNDESAQLALLFYREPDLLRLVLVSAKIPDGADRVALSLNHHERGPFIIVSREGRFITCLGEGMHLGDRFVVPRRILDAASWIHCDVTLAGIFLSILLDASTCNSLSVSATSMRSCVWFAWSRGWDTRRT